MEDIDGLFRTKWNYNREYNYVGATCRITADGDDGLHALVRHLRQQNPNLPIHVYTGAHANPGGMFQLPEDEFSNEDFRKLHDPPAVAVIGISIDEVMSQDLTKVEVSLNYPFTITVLGWCYSWETLIYQLPHIIDERTLAQSWSARLSEHHDRFGQI